MNGKKNSPSENPPPNNSTRPKRQPLLADAPLCHVYRNLHKHVWSVRLKSTGRVCAHLPALDLVDCEFRVSAAGRERAVREGRRNVHAVVAGRVARSYTPRGETASVSYNPFRSPHFHDRTTGRSLVRAARVRFFADGRAVAFRPEFLP